MTSAVDIDAPVGSPDGRRRIPLTARSLPTYSLYLAPDVCGGADMSMSAALMALLNLSFRPKPALPITFAVLKTMFQRFMTQRSGRSRMQRILGTIVSALVAMVAVVGLATPPSAAGTTTVPTSDVTIQAPFGGCNGFAWLVLNRSEVRIYASSDTVRARLEGREYGLLWVNILNSNRVSQQHGAYNLSSHAPFRNVFTVKNNWYMSISVTDDDNTVTLCSSTSQR